MQAHRILVVDDSASYRKLLSHSLQKLGFEVSDAADGYAALALLDAQPQLALVVCDWDMPHLNGIEFCQAVRTRAFSRYIYVILVTAHNDSDSLIIGMEAGADDFLIKPINFNELRVRLRAGQRVLALEQVLAERNRTLDEAYHHIARDLYAAANLQRSMLPEQRISCMPFACEWLFIPSAFLSGDMLNVFELDCNRIVFYTIDVAGHGVQAAMLSVIVGHYLSKDAAQTGMDSSRKIHGKSSIAVRAMVADLNRQFQSKSADMPYFTMIYGMLDRRTGEGALVQAGHTHPLHVNEAGNVTALGTGGFPVALLPECEYEAVPFTLARGDRLYLYSDGVTECEGVDGVAFGEDRMVGHVLAHHYQPLEEVLTTLEGVLGAWRGAAASTFADDVSVLAIEHR